MGLFVEINKYKGENTVFEEDTFYKLKMGGIC